MHSSNRNAANLYAQVGIETAVNSVDPHKLVSMLFEGAIKAIAAARHNMQRKQIAAKGEYLSKAIAIIDEGLKASLDLNSGGEIAQNLAALYEYMCKRLLQANLKNEIEPLDEIGRMLSDLKKSWDSIGNQPAPVAPTASETVKDTKNSSYGKA